VQSTQGNEEEIIIIETHQTPKWNLTTYAMIHAFIWQFLIEICNLNQKRSLLIKARLLWDVL
jgi:hypothetical protein